MDYEKKYKEALEKANVAYKDEDRHLKATLEKLFPELKESEDERISCEITEFLVDFNNGVYERPNENTIDSWLSWLEKQKDTLKDIEQKPAWSEEDEKMMNDTLAVVDWYAGVHKNISKKIGNWLKSIKNRCLPQKKQEWSEEDERNLQGIIDEIEANKNGAPDYDLATYDRYLSWLKSLRPQNTWKPSEEQMKALKGVQEGVFRLGILESLYQDLKKLL